MTVMSCRWPSFALVGLLSGLSISAQAADCYAPEFPSVYTMMEGAQETISLPGQITRIAIGEPTTADVALIDSKTILLQGRKAGSTSLFIWTKCQSEPLRTQVAVQLPPSVAETLAPITPEELSELPSQVQVDIRFVELSRSRLRELGVELNRLTSNFSLTSAAAKSNPFSIFLSKSNGKLSAAIDMLEQTGYAYTLSQPSLTAMSGQSATFLAGGEVPIPVPGGNGSAPTIEYKEFGVRLSVTPTVLSRSQVSLKVAPEVSELDFANAVTLEGATVPALRVRRTDTTISLGDGESFVISGLVSRSMRDNTQKFPGLGDIPVLGALFRSTSFRSDDSELLMIVTPHLVKPIAANAATPKLPGDAWRRYEPDTIPLFLEGAKSPYGDAPIGFSR
ncbi:MAG: type II and III secretion system protein family protein [Paraperlucidibaca sp.]